jgi:hypothetical protein
MDAREPGSVRRHQLTSATVVLDVKVKPVHDGITEGTRLVSGLPVVGLGTKGSPEPVGKLGGGINSVDLIGVMAATEGQEDLLAGCLANGNVLHEVWTLRVQLGRDAINEVGVSPALIPKVTSGQSGQRVLIRETIDEPDVDDVKRRFLTELGKTRLIITLTLDWQLSQSAG